jgi:hypothetical protein
LYLSQRRTRPSLSPRCLLRLVPSCIPRLCLPQRRSRPSLSPRCLSRLVPSCTRQSCSSCRKYLSSSPTSPGHPRPTEKDSRLEPWPRTETRRERPQARPPCSRQTPALAGVQNEATACSGRRPSSPPSALPPHGALVVRALSIALEIRCARSQCQSESRKRTCPVLLARSSTSSEGRVLAIRFFETPSNVHRVRKEVPVGVGRNASGGATV